MNLAKKCRAIINSLNGILKMKPTIKNNKEEKPTLKELMDKDISNQYQLLSYTWPSFTIFFGGAILLLILATTQIIPSNKTSNLFILYSLLALLIIGIIINIFYYRRIRSK